MSFSKQDTNLKSCSCAEQGNNSVPDNVWDTLDEELKKLNLNAAGEEYCLEFSEQEDLINLGQELGLTLGEILEMIHKGQDLPKSH